jgi:hypothetical protein
MSIESYFHAYRQSMSVGRYAVEGLKAAVELVHGYKVRRIMTTGSKLILGSFALAAFAIRYAEAVRYPANAKVTGWFPIAGS